MCVYPRNLQRMERTTRCTWPNSPSTYTHTPSRQMRKKCMSFSEPYLYIIHSSFLAPIRSSHVWIVCVCVRARCVVRNTAGIGIIAHCITLRISEYYNTQYRRFRYINTSTFYINFLVPFGLKNHESILIFGVYSVHIIYSMCIFIYIYICMYWHYSTRIKRDERRPQLTHAYAKNENEKIK